MTDIRDLDVAVLGAGGVTGRWIARHIAERAPQLDVQWAVAVRDASKLRQALDELGVAVPEILYADAFEPKSLRELASRAKVVINAAGPFTPHSRNVVEACIAEGAHYVDITGETQLVRRTIRDFHDAAVHAGIKVVQVCGYAATPADLAVLIAAETAERRWAEPLAAVELQWFVKAPQRLRGADIGGKGTFRSLAESLNDPDSRTVTDPAALLPDGEVAERVRRENPINLAPRMVRGAPVAPMLFSGATPIVHRTAALRAAEQGSSLRPFIYREGWVLPGRTASLAGRLFGASAIAASQMAIRGVASARPGIRRRVAGALRAALSGDGRSTTFERQQEWHSSMSICARTDGGHRLFVHITCEGHFAYLSTGRITGEAALMLSTDGLTPYRAGCLTPAMALGTEAIDRFENACVRISIDR